MQTYNETIRGANMDLVFKDALTHLIKISRIIRTPSGNALLVGVGARAIPHQTCFLHCRLQSLPNPHTIVQCSELVGGLESVHRDAGVHEATFILTDNEIKDEGFLEPMNSCSQWDFGLARDETDEILAELVPIMKKAAPKVPPQDNLYDFFISRASPISTWFVLLPIGEKFPQRSLKFPDSSPAAQWTGSLLAKGHDCRVFHFLQKFPLVCSEKQRHRSSKQWAVCTIVSGDLSRVLSSVSDDNSRHRNLLVLLEATGIYGKDLEHLNTWP